MGAGKELFKLFGLIGMQGVEGVENDLKKIDKQVRKAQREFDKFGKSVVSVGKTLTKAFTLPMAAAAVAANSMIEAASDLNETMTKTEAIFGESTDSIKQWSKSTASAIGQSQTQALDAAATFGIFGQSAGLAGEKLVNFSTEFVELASDMASFFNTSPDEAITAIGAAFRGEMEPIRKYGVLLDDATMRQKAFELGLVSSTKNALMPQTKILAAQALILEQTTKAQGDFAKTSGGLANQKRILAARLKDVSATLGESFLPLMLDVVGVLQKGVGVIKRVALAYKDLDGPTKSTIKGVALLLAAVGPLTVVFGKLILVGKAFIPVLAMLKAGTLSFSAAIKALNIQALVVVGTIAALVALGWYYYNNWKTISTQLAVIWEKMKLVALQSAQAMVNVFTELMLVAMNAFDGIASVIPGAEAKLNSFKKSIYSARAEMGKLVGEQLRATIAASEQAGANTTLGESLQKAKEATKALLGAQQESDKLTQKQIEDKKEAAKQEEELANKRREYEAKTAEGIRAATLTRTELLEIEKQEAIRQAEELGANVFAVKELYALKELELQNTINAEKDRAREQQDAKDKASLQTKFNIATNLANKLGSILNKHDQNRMTRIDKSHQDELKKIEASGASEEAKAKAIAVLEQKTADKKLKIQKEQAAREKLLALFSIGINTASAIVEALPNIPLSVAVGVLGAAEAAVVATTPTPFFDGGLIEGTPGGVNAIVGERNQSEVVFPLESGIELLSEGLVERLTGPDLPGVAQIPDPEASAFAGANVTLQVGTLVADEKGLKELYRALDKIGISENQRKGRG